MLFFLRVPSVSLHDVNDYSRVIDVRTSSEFRSGHLKGCKNVPLDRLHQFKASQQPVYVICETGARSKAAVKYLRKQGIDAYNVLGGMVRYRRHGGSK